MHGRACNAVGVASFHVRNIHWGAARDYREMMDESTTRMQTYSSLKLVHNVMMMNSGTV